MLSAVIAMTALSKSDHGNRRKEASDTLHRKYCTNGSRPPASLHREVHRKPACGLVRGRRWTHPESDAGEGRPPRFLGNPSTRVPRSSTPMKVARPCLGRTDHCGLPKNLRRRPPPHAPLRGSITRPTCVLSTLHDEGHPIAMQDALPACWLGVNMIDIASGCAKRTYTF